jgi:hypothetical protein
MTKTLALTEIADALDTLVDLMISDRMDELAGCSASFWRDAAWQLHVLADEEEPSSRRGPTGATGFSRSSEVTMQSSGETWVGGDPALLLLGLA